MLTDQFRTACDTKNRVGQCRLIQSIPGAAWVYEHDFSWVTVERILITLHPLHPLPIGANAYDWVTVGVNWQDGSVQHVGVFASDELTLPDMLAQRM